MRGRACTAAADMCAALQVPRGPIFMSYWGLTVPWSWQNRPDDWRPGTPPLGASPHFRGPDWTIPCADKRDVVMPAVQPQAHFGGVPPDASPRWECELFFAGPVRKGGSWCASTCKIASPADSDRPCIIGGTRSNWTRCYGQGVRGELFYHHENRSRFCIHRRVKSVRSA